MLTNDQQIKSPPLTSFKGPFSFGQDEAKTSTDDQPKYSPPFKLRGPFPFDQNDGKTSTDDQQNKSPPVKVQGPFSFDLSHGKKLTDDRQKDSLPDKARGAFSFDQIAEKTSKNDHQKDSPPDKARGAFSFDQIAENTSKNDQQKDLPPGKVGGAFSFDQIAGKTSRNDHQKDSSPDKTRGAFSFDQIAEKTSKNDQQKDSPPDKTQVAFSFDQIAGKISRNDQQKDSPPDKAQVAFSFDQVARKTSKNDQQVMNKEAVSANVPNLLVVKTNPAKANSMTKPTETKNDSIFSKLLSSATTKPVEQKVVEPKTSSPKFSMANEPSPVGGMDKSSGQNKMDNPDESSSDENGAEEDDLDLQLYLSDNSEEGDREKVDNSAVKNFIDKLVEAKKSGAKPETSQVSNRKLDASSHSDPSAAKLETSFQPFASNLSESSDSDGEPISVPVVFNTSERQPSPIQVDSVKASPDNPSVSDRSRDPDDGSESSEVDIHRCQVCGEEFRCQCHKLF